MDEKRTWDFSWLVVREHCAKDAQNEQNPYGDPSPGPETSVQGDPEAAPLAKQDDQKDDQPGHQEATQQVADEIGGHGQSLPNWSEKEKRSFLGRQRDITVHPMLSAGPVGLALQ
ncbi:hypothetical protein HER14_16490 [Acidithiobacillus thiooxidans]|uniref:hypothetical protein n=1 Tax=Acidithiobacillus thiooxidans TaxID=930 RepID=UPI001C077645|nr:hypothetical protein [Acidithiobacillus thiooxidans]MBU2752479.1 hypothetical protein [Acidithiobacillus thiooxidans]